MFKTKYRITVDWYDPDCFAIDKKTWFFPFWIECYGLIRTEKDAWSLLDRLEKYQ